MKQARYLLAVCLLAVAAWASAADWLDTDITDIINNVQGIYNRVVLGEVHDMARDLGMQIDKRSDTITDTADEVLTWLGKRRAPYLDFVDGGAEKCGSGSACAQFRADLEVFALDIADLKDRFPVFQRMGLDDTRLLADAARILPPFVLFGLYEIFRSVPGWQELPADLAALYDEIGDPDAFAVDSESATQAIAASDTRVQIAANMRTAATIGLGKAKTPADDFCSKGKQPLVDSVRLNRLKALLTRWKNTFNSIAEFQSEGVTIDLAGMGIGNYKPKAAPFLKTLGNGIDSILNQVDTYRANLGACAAVEADVAQCTPLVAYRTPDGVRKAYWVVYGIVSRESDQDVPLDTTTADKILGNARYAYNRQDWKGAYANICAAYKAL